MEIETPEGIVTKSSDIPDLPIIPPPQAPAEVGIPGVCEPTLDGVGEPDKDTRPSLDVALENLAHLAARVAPLCGRLRSWDIRALDAGIATRFQGSVADLEDAFVRMSDQLVAMRAMGYVAKTTPITRLRAKLSPGVPVRLTSKALVEFAGAFGQEQLDSITVARTTATHALLSCSDGTNLGLVKLSCIELKDPVAQAQQSSEA